MHLIKTISVTLIANLLLAQPVFAAEWQVVGAGNATCHNWSSASVNQKTEILSWMAGFASAMNLDKASEKQPEWRMDLFTYDYLRDHINRTCSEAASREKGMFSILMEILSDFPVAK